MFKKHAPMIAVAAIAVLSIGCGGTRVYQRDVVYRDVPTVVHTPAPAPAPAPAGYYDRWGNWHPYGYYDAWGNWHEYPPPR